MIVLWCLGYLHGVIQALRERPTARRPHTAWTGPWPPGCLPISVVLGDAPAEWVGYVEVPAAGEPDLAGFWRLHADALDWAREGRQA